MYQSFWWLVCCIGYRSNFQTLESEGKINFKWMYDKVKKEFDQTNPQNDKKSNEKH